jgi:hypothetical protein
MALGATKQAAEHLLSALALQRPGETALPTSSPSSVWDMLRMAFLMMERGDLAHKCDDRNVDAFRPEWEF